MEKFLVSIKIHVQSRLSLRYIEHIFFGKVFGCNVPYLKRLSNQPNRQELRREGF